MQIGEFFTKLGFALDDANLKKFEDSLDGLKKDSKALSNTLGKVSAELIKIGKTASTYITAPLAGLAGYAVHAAGEVEMLSTSFEVLLGSAEDGQKLFKELFELAKYTPYNVEGLARGARTMLAFNTEVEDVLPTLKKLGDIALGDKERLARLTLAFSQSASAGKLMGQDLLQMTSAGFNPLAEIADETGKTLPQLRKEMEQGKISIDMVRRAVDRATSSGGKFYKGSEKGAKTLFGLLTTFHDSLYELAYMVGTFWLPTINKALKKLTTMVRKLQSAWTDLSTGQKKAITVTGILVAAIGPLLFLLGHLLGLLIKIKMVTMFFGSPQIMTGLKSIVAHLGKVKIVFTGISGVLASIAGLLFLIIGVFASNPDNMLKSWKSLLIDIQNVLISIINLLPFVDIKTKDNNVDLPMSNYTQRMANALGGKSSAATNNSNSVTNDVKVDVTLPPGTTAEHKKQIEEISHQVFQSEVAKLNQNLSTNAGM